MDVHSISWASSSNLFNGIIVGKNRERNKHANKSLP